MPFNRVGSRYRCIAEKVVVDYYDRVVAVRERVSFIRPSSLVSVEVVSPLFSVLSSYFVTPHCTCQTHGSPWVRSNGRRKNAPKDKPVTIDARLETETRTTWTAVRLAALYFVLPRGAHAHKQEREERPSRTKTYDRALRAKERERERAREMVVLNRDNLPDGAKKTFAERERKREREKQFWVSRRREMAIGRSRTGGSDRWRNKRVLHESCFSKKGNERDKERKRGRIVCST